MPKRNTIVYFPYVARGDKINDYLLNMAQLLGEKYAVAGELAEPTHILALVKTKAIILNWAEEQLGKKMKLQIWMYKLFGAKCIWVFHNKFPHGAVQGDWRVKRNMNWLANSADSILLHAKSSAKYIPNGRLNRKKAVFVPHIMYETKISRGQVDEIKKKYEIKDDDFIFLMFGFLKPYKHYEDGIEAFKALELKHAKLIVAGNASSAEYARYLRSICEGVKDIILDIRYIPNMTLDAIIRISDVVVLPYDNASSMNSGVMIRAFSNAKTVVTPNICMAKDIAQYGFIYRYKSGLKGAMKKAYTDGKKVNMQMGERAYKYVQRFNNKEVISRKMDYILNN